MPRQPTCRCGACERCRNREAVRRYYKRRKAEAVGREGPPRLHEGGNRSERIPPTNRDERRRERKRLDNERLRNLRPEQKRAYNAVEYELRMGRMTREPCEVCGDEQSHAHHHDYQRPLDVRWLCAQHHADEHARLAAQEHASGPLTAVLVQDTARSIQEP